MFLMYLVLQDPSRVRNGFKAEACHQPVQYYL